jgi:AhpD family alkylhydroperoxidase
LICIGASISAYCGPCVKKQVSLARGNGVNEKKFVDVIDLGQMIRKGVAGEMDKFINQMGSSVPITSGPNAGLCCG